MLCLILLQTLLGCVTSRSSDAGEKLTCEQHAKVAAYLNNWAITNFSESYGKKGDVTGANVQLFLISEKAPSPYAAAFNRYQEKAFENIALAKRKGCNTVDYPLPPVDEFRHQLEVARTGK
ncbi:hypothetical protein SAMN06295900_10989 [Trinickia caryophylli]|uniref:Uncharacterized protein n=2 Tax=Trinickia caryophylli TaxID=28094 RepID=A0A1X7FIZ0_TRICW|nr:hypothetical protein SAMN06295900_10989 [Trinickia caryophylli]